ncbi:MAG TPA: hypothetical protein VF625_00255 [Longimicrobium sp.]|jgi:hypothetical protein
MTSRTTLVFFSLLLLFTAPGMAQRIQIADPRRAEPVLDSGRPFQAASRLPVSTDSVGERPRSSIPVLLLATLGAGVLGTSAAAGCFEMDCGLTRLEVGLGVGAATGAVAGAWIGGRRPAPLQTAAGAALGTAAMMLIDHAAGGEDADIQIILSSAALPVIGAWLGNGRGQ